MKAEILFNARNSFTHKGLPYGSPVGGVHKSYRYPALEDGKTVELMQNILEGSYDDKFLLVQVSSWPELLISVIENTLTKLQTDS